MIKSSEKVNNENYEHYVNDEIIGHYFKIKIDSTNITRGKFYKIISYNEDSDSQIGFYNDLNQKEWLPKEAFNFNYFIEAERQSEVAKFKTYPFDPLSGNVEDEIDHAKRNIYKNGFKQGFLKASILHNNLINKK